MIVSQPVTILVLANILIPAALVVFASGFFPYKPLLPGFAQQQDSNHGSEPIAPFNRLVFMVVDALRRLCISAYGIALATKFCCSDFVFGHASGFEFTQKSV